MHEGRKIRVPYALKGRVGEDTPDLVAFYKECIEDKSQCFKIM